MAKSHQRLHLPGLSAISNGAGSPLILIFIALVSHNQCKNKALDSFYRRKRKTNLLPGGFLHRGDKDSFGSWWALTCHVVPNRRTNRLGHRSSNPLVISSVKLRTNLEIVTNDSAIYVFLQNGDAVRFPTSNNGIARREAFIKNSQHRKAASRLFLTATLMR